MFHLSINNCDLGLIEILHEIDKAQTFAQDGSLVVSVGKRHRQVHLGVPAALIPRNQIHARVDGVELNAGGSPGPTAVVLGVRKDLAPEAGAVAGGVDGEDAKPGSALATWLRERATFLDEDAARECTGAVESAQERGVRPGH